MTTITSGDVIIEGVSLVQNLREIRKKISLCPQHDLLFPNLTVWEHLQFYGKLNGNSGQTLNQQCKSLLNDIGLSEKTKFLSSSLSGGQKRKLSVCIALIGNNTLVILDEPTTYVFLLFFFSNIF